MNLSSVRENSKDKLKSIMVRNLTVFSHLLLIPDLQRSIRKFVAGISESAPLFKLYLSQYKRAVIMKILNITLINIISTESILCLIYILWSFKHLFNTENSTIFLQYHIEPISLLSSFLTALIRWIYITRDNQQLTFSVVHQESEPSLYTEAWRSFTDEWLNCDVRKR